MENLISTLSVPIITTLVIGAMALVKYTFKEQEKIIRLIPVFSALLGAALGLAAFYLAPSDMPANNFLSAILIGALSGLAATGGHQIYKQFSDCANKGTENTESPLDKSEKQSGEEDKAD